MHPLKVILSNLPPAQTVCTVPNFPFDPTRGSHTVTIENEIFIDKSDFRMEDSDDYYGLAPGKIVGLKYAFRIVCDKVETNKEGEPVLLRCTVLGESERAEEKIKAAIQWVPCKTAVSAEVRLYNHLFTVEEPTDAEWEAQLNPESLIVCPNAKVDPSIMDWKPVAESHFQLERIGFFVVDRDSTSSKLVLNLTVNLKDSKPKPTGAPTKSRKEEQAKQLAEKMARMNINPLDMFRSQTDLYSQFDAEGIPTHDAAGEKISKSAYKKLKKDWEKQKQLYESRGK